MLKEQTSLSTNKQYVLHDVGSPFTNIPVDKTISYIINESYQKNKLDAIMVHRVCKIYKGVCSCRESYIILLKLLGKLRYVGMSTIIQCKSKIH